MKRFFIGIDISKNWLDLAIWDKDLNQIIEQSRFDNKQKQMSDYFEGMLEEYSLDELWICFEHTGNYGLVLCGVLEHFSLSYSVVPALEIKQSQGMKRGKSDRVDAERIAEYAAVHSHKLKATESSSSILLKAKALLTYRNQLIKERSAYKNSLKSHRLTEKITQDDFIVDRIKLKIDQLNIEVKQLEKKLSDVLKEDDVIAKNLSLAQSVKGIGFISAATIIVLTKNFDAFTDPRKFNCYSGLAPFENSSGLSNPSAKTSMLRNKKMKTLLMNAANSAIRSDPQLKGYFKRKLKEGKNKMSILNAVCCKLIYRVFAVIKRQSPYVILQN